MLAASLQGHLLAVSDSWSELIIILLLIGIPAIIRSLSEAAGKRKDDRIRGSQKIQDISKHKIGSRGLQPSEKPAKPPRGPLSEWDRRQQDIRDHMNKLKEQAEAAVAGRRHRRPQPPVKPHAQAVPEEVLPIAQALPEEPKPVVQPPRPPVHRPTQPAPVRLPEKVRQYVQAAPAAAAVQQQIHRPKPQAKVNKRVAVQKPKPPAVNPFIERIMRSSNPLQAGIVLKEILDKPKSLQFGSDL